MLRLVQMRSPGVGVVDMHGTIGGAVKPHEFVRLLSKLRDERAVGAVVLNIDSPGGSAPGSELIARAVLRLREEKPVAAFVGGLGASGGYMIAAAAQHIVAIPTALVGSIGVIAYRPLVHEALERLGLQMRVSKSGRLKDMLSPFREPTDDELQREQHLLDATYEVFVRGVAAHRGLPVERVRELATGEVFVAQDAVGNGLVDATGDLDDAIDWVTREARIARKVKFYRPRRSLRELLLQRGVMSASGLAAGALDAALGNVAGRAALEQQALYIPGFTHRLE